MALIHARGAYRLELLLGQFGRGEAAAAFAKALELLIFFRADKIAGNLSVVGDGDWLTLRAHPLAAEVAGELGSRDGFRGGIR